MPSLVHPTTPHFPALYWPISVLPDEPQYLYSVKDSWRFTLFWTLIVFEACHLAASSYAFAVQWRNWKIMMGVMIVYAILAGIEALMAGSVVGLLYVRLCTRVLHQGLYYRADEESFQSWCRLQGWWLSNVDLDSFYMGRNQCAGYDPILFLHPRWSLNDQHRLKSVPRHSSSTGSGVSSSDTRAGELHLASVPSSA